MEAKRNARKYFGIDYTRDYTVKLNNRTSWKEGVSVTTRPYHAPIAGGHLSMVKETDKIINRLLGKE